MYDGIVNLSGILPGVTLSVQVVVFLIFLVPFGPGASAGIVLAQREGIAPGLIIALYVASDVAAALILEPLLRVIRRRAERRPLGRQLFDGIEQLSGKFKIGSGSLGRPASLFALTFATDFYSASVASFGLRIWRPLAWTMIIAGDVIWFLIILAATYGIAAFLSDDRILLGGSLIVGVLLPLLVQRLVQRLVGVRHIPPTAVTEAPRSGDAPASSK